MRSTLIVASALAIGALAGPIDKRKVVTDYELDVETVVVYVTPGAPAVTPESHNNGGYNHHHYYSQKPKSSAAPVPSSSQAPPPPAYTPAPAYTPSPTPTPTPTPVYTPPPASSEAAPASSAPASNYGSHKSGDVQATFSSGPDYIAAILYHHNVIRANHGAGELTWDDSCASNAQLAAQRCDFTHYIPDGAGQGQNLFTVSGDSFNVTAGIHESWYKGELPKMDGLWGAESIEGDAFEGVGHFTQVVWKGTTKVGCYSMDCSGRMTLGGASSDLDKYTVCNYASAGNFEGQFAENVQKPTDPNNLGSWSD